MHSKIRFQFNAIAYLAIAFFYFYYPTIVAAQSDDDESIQVYPHWNLNDTFLYSVIKSKVNYKNNGSVKDSVSDMEFKRLVVMDSSDFGYKICVTNETVAELRKLGLTEKEAIALGDKYSDPVVRYNVDLDGNYLGLDHEARFVRIVQNRIRASIGKYADNAKKSKEEIEFMQRPENILREATKDIELLHDFLGGEYYLDNPIDFDFRSPNPLSSTDSIPSKCFIVMKKSEGAGGLLEVNFIENMYIDGETYVQGFVETPSVSLKQFKDKKVIICTKVDYFIDPVKGIVVYCKLTKDILANEKMTSRDLIELYLMDSDN
jgi:hypothetical protein